jgi:hypothetical protein
VKRPSAAGGINEISDVPFRAPFGLPHLHLTQLLTNLPATSIADLDLWLPERNCLPSPGC